MKSAKGLLDGFPLTPPQGNMQRKDLMARLGDRLTEQSLNVRPVYKDDACSEIHCFIVAVDNLDNYLPQDQG